MADQLKILSAGAVKPGLTKVIDAFEQSSGTKVQTSFATAPAILQQIGSGALADVVVAPASVLEELTKSGKCTVSETTDVGRIGVGAFVRNGEPLPDIATVEAFKQSLLAAGSVVYNRASTGVYLEKLFASLGIAEALKGKSTRYPDLGAVLDHVGKGLGEEIGFGATTVIIENENSGVTFAGVLPAEIQNYTSYVAALLPQADARQNARRFIRYLGTSEARSFLAAAGIE